MNDWPLSSRGVDGEAAFEQEGQNRCDDHCFVECELGDEITMGNVIDRLGFLSATRCDIST
jgi:hypothetical protein